jgi:hypothetical protein
MYWSSTNPQTKKTTSLNRTLPWQASLDGAIMTETMLNLNLFGIYFKPKFIGENVAKARPAV